ncbi:hypothetical protein PybrP1_000380 [[Pythium] brassicae (nom. inval.)]|nr:hypothetical protein PybrP1_000380 [[Pythium] brassicae (nom. inval.)]
MRESDALLLMLLYRKGKKTFKLALLDLHVERPTIPSGRFDICSVSDAYCTADFRFDRRGVVEMWVLLRVPAVVVTNAGDRISAAEVLFIALNSQAHPSRLISLTRMFRRSNADLCRNFLRTVDYIQACWERHLYFSIDPAYGLSQYPISRFNGAHINDQQRDLNRAMTSGRKAVEWSFGRMKSLWAFVDSAKKHKIMLPHVGKIVKVAMLLTNCHFCHNQGDLINDYFSLSPPTLVEYLTTNEN